MSQTKTMSMQHSPTQNDFNATNIANRINLKETQIEQRRQKDNGVF